MRGRGAWLSAVLFVCAACSRAGVEPGEHADASVSASTTALRVPELGPVPELPSWPDNVPSEARRELGRALFFDARLSQSGHTSCNTCHNYLSSFQDALPRSIPDRSYPSDRPVTERNATALLNVVYAPVYRWDGSSQDLWDVAAFPFSEPNMSLGEDVPSAQRELAARLGSIAAYVRLFEDAYAVRIRERSPAEVWQLAGKAIAQYLRGAVSRDARFDRWNAGDDAALSAAELRGLELFRGEARCIACHNGPLFTDFGYHNVSSAVPRADGTRDDEGRARVTGKPSDGGKFLTPTLRSSWETAPYFHDGSLAALSTVIVHKTGDAARRDPAHSLVFDTTRELTNAEVEDLVAFLGALRGERTSDMGPPSTLPQ